MSDLICALKPNHGKILKVAPESTTEIGDDGRIVDLSLEEQNITMD